MSRFEGRTVIVTGAERGLGRAYAEYLAALGANVVVNDVDDDVDELPPALEAIGGVAISVSGDVAASETAGRIVEAALDTFGRVDAVINNAGVGLSRGFAQTPMSEFQRLLDVHLFGAVRLSQEVWPHMARRRYGRIVNTVSAAMYGFADWSAYSAAKGAVLGATRAMAIEGVDSGILVNAIMPGAATAMVTGNDVDEAVARQMAETMPASLVAPAAAHLAHETCSLSGRAIVSAGGRVGEMVLAQSELTDMPGATISSIAQWVETNDGPIRPVSSALDALAF